MTECRRCPDGEAVYCITCMNNIMRQTDGHLERAEARVAELRAAIAKAKALPVLTKADEDTPDDKEEAYILGYGDALQDVQQALKEGE